MYCPTCDHTMQKLDSRDPINFWCPRCGTLTIVVGTTRIDHAPKLVERCRSLVAKVKEGKPQSTVTMENLLLECHTIGILESINVPESR